MGVGDCSSMSITVSCQNTCLIFINDIIYCISYRRDVVTLFYHTFSLVYCSGAAIQLLPIAILLLCYWQDILLCYVRVVTVFLVYLLYAVLHASERS